MKNKFGYMLFDLDGTLTESGPGIMNCVKYALEKFGIVEESNEALKRFIGPPLVDSFMNFYGFSEADARKAMAFYRERFSPVGIFENSVYDGIKETLEKLKSDGTKLFVATSKPEIYVPKILSHFDLDGYFEFAGGSDLAETRSEKAKVIDFVIKQNSLEKEAACGNVVMIGDRLHDVAGAKKNGIPCIGVLWGYGSREELEKYGADFIISRPEELLGFSR